MSIQIGDEVTYTPYRKGEDSLTGIVSEEIRSPGGELGYHLLLSADRYGQRTARIWTSQGTIIRTNQEKL